MLIRVYSLYGERDAHARAAPRCEIALRSLVIAVGLAIQRGIHTENAR
jgi:hypothetical protein